MGKVIGMERKITKFGNSLGITMTEAIKQLGLSLEIRFRLKWTTTVGKLSYKNRTK